MALLPPCPRALLADAGLLTRDVLGNIPATAQAVFFSLALAAVAAFSWGVWRRARLWRLGRPTPPGQRSVVRNLVRDVLLQSRVRGRGWASLGHGLLFWGFVVMTIGTVLIAIEHLLATLLGRPAGQPVFHKGTYYAIYELVLDGFGLAFLAGGLTLAVRRRRRPPSLDHNGADWCVLALLLAIGATGFVVEGLRIVHAQTPSPGYSFAGAAVASGLKSAGVDGDSAKLVHRLVWWLHAVLALGLIAAFPFTRLRHAVAGALNLAAGRHPLGVLPLVALEEVERTGTLGAGQFTDFTRRQLVELDACVACGRCEEVCPAFAAGKPLSPRALVQGIRAAWDVVGPHVAAAGRSAAQSPALHEATVAAETLWSCTACSACVDVCPLDVNPLGFITDMRRYLVAEARLRGAPAAALQKTARSGNPWGMPPAERMAWADGLHVPSVADRPDFEVLYWVGCAAAYDRRIGNVARSVVRLLGAAGIKFAVLGSEERCTGDSARRMGDELLFQVLARTNIDTLQRHGVKKIVTHCPHCLNSFQHDYPQLGGQYEVVHHSQFLAELVAAGRLPLENTSPAAAASSVTYHDPCYLARVNGVVDEPRQVVRAALGAERHQTPVELPRHGRQASCCGAGGGRMWFDDEVSQRVGRDRVEEVLASGAATVAVACPFCLLMLRDGVAARDSRVEVRDIAEILANRLPSPSPTA